MLKTATVKTSRNLQMNFQTHFCTTRGLWTLEHVRKGFLKGQNEQEERFQQAKPASVFISSPDSCFKADLKKSEAIL